MGRQGYTEKPCLRKRGENMHPKGDVFAQWEKRIGGSYGQDPLFICMESVSKRYFLKRCVMC